MQFVLSAVGTAVWCCERLRTLPGQARRSVLAALAANR